MLFKSLKYDVFRDCAVCGRKVPPAPKVAAPIAMLQPWKFAEKLKGGSVRYPSHQLAHGNFGRDRHEDVQVVRRYEHLQDLHAIFCAHLPGDFPNPDLHVTTQDFEAVFGRPDQVIAMVKNVVLSSVELHDYSLRKKIP